MSSKPTAPTISYPFPNHSNPIPSNQSHLTSFITYSTSYPLSEQISSLIKSLFQYHPNRPVVLRYHSYIFSFSSYLTRDTIGYFRDPCVTFTSMHFWWSEFAILSPNSATFHHPIQFLFWDEYSVHKLNSIVECWRVWTQNGKL